MDASSLLRLAWPLILIQVGFQVYALLDLYRRRRVRTLTLPVWVGIVVLGEILGPIAYFLFGQAES